MQERFEPRSFSSEREWSTQLFLGLMIRIRLVVVTFACKTLPEVVMKALECKHALQTHHQTGGSGQSSQ